MGIGVARSADMLDFEISGTRFRECYVITVLWDVTLLTSYLGQTSVPDENADFISRGCKSFLVFNIENWTPGTIHKDTKSCVLLRIKVSFSVKKGKC